MANEKKNMGKLYELFEDGSKEFVGEIDWDKIIEEDKRIKKGFMRHDILNAHILDRGILN